MAKPRKWTPEERAERLKREREFRELLEKRRALDQKLGFGSQSEKMAKPRKSGPEAREERLKREREFRELLEKRVELDKKLAAERKRPEAS